ncbi:MAG: DUF4186 family protein [Chitinophagales bacterium]|nr:DUF4186 family protein [Chitinophagales bacterium]
MAFQKVKPEKPVKDLTPLDVKCTTTRCRDNFHCFKTSQKMIENYGKTGVCRDCGEDVVDWDRIRKNDVNDHGYMFDVMKLELLRHVCWNMDLQTEITEFAQKRGKRKLRERARKILQQKIGKAINFREGYQTAKTGREIIHYAMHATATCCRPCMEYWHNIPMGTDLTNGQLDYATDLVMLFVEDRIKNLSDEGLQKVAVKKLR